MTDPSVRDLTTALGKRLSLTVEEDVGLDLDDSDEAQWSGGGARWCLVSTVLTRKKYNLEAMENTLAGIWRPVKGMHMRILGNNFFAFYFFHPVDMQQVLAVGPWRFANHVMVLQESAAGRPVKKEDLFEIRLCSEDLAHWNSTHFGHVQKQVKQCIRPIESIRQQPVSESTIEEEKRLLTETEEWLEREEVMWHQRSREIWLQEGDRNTRFFHKRASRRKDHNTINKLQGKDGVWKYDFQDLQHIATDYFSTLFSSSQPTAIHRVTCCLQSCVSIQDNALLLRDFTENDITQALFHMHPSKAPGPDGLSPAFFQQFWNIVKEDVVRPYLQFLNHGGALPQDLNFTHIVLIPKRNEPRTMANLRPISLCNVVYRILAKVLANRFKQVLQTVISQEQSAFLPNRLITDNFLIAYEVLHYMRSRKNRKK
ncbi:hypothetical protein SLEP1_g6663 [Rubroshorea leprosula]|uniref:DUF4283 domain-containing protein n=1 Tax=Rubroshorea leprosula TaxID=152421 RepID=A0AAV5HVX9_9ROSI|nr:hypothetical protein SLEP1_g6663 [Rubroshorea leprosula]